MTAPLDEAATRRTLVILGAAVAAWMVPVYLFLRARAVGGEQLGWALCGVPLGLGAALVAWFVGRRLPSPFTYPITAAVVGAVLGLQLFASAPLGRDRLAAYVGGLDLEGRIVDERSSGSTTCARTCPTLSRTYELGYTRTNVGQTVLESKLLGQGFSVDDLVRKRDAFTISNEVVEVDAAFSRSEKGVLVKLEFTSKRR